MNPRRSNASAETRRTFFPTTASTSARRSGSAGAEGSLGVSKPGTNTRTVPDGSRRAQKPPVRSSSVAPRASRERTSRDTASGSPCLVHSTTPDDDVPRDASTQDGQVVLVGPPPPPEPPPEPPPGSPPPPSGGGGAETATGVADTGPWNVDTDAVSTSSSR